MSLGYCDENFLLSPFDGEKEYVLWTDPSTILRHNNLSHHGKLARYMLISHAWFRVHYVN